jgi:signal transduction histidine kinase
MSWVLVPVILVVGITWIAAWGLLNQQLEERINQHLTREAQELSVLAEKAIDPNTDFPFVNSADLLEQFIQRTIPDANETMFVVVDGSVQSRTTDKPPVRIDKNIEFIDLVTKTSEPTFGDLQTESGRVRYLIVPVVGETDSGALVAAMFADAEGKEIASVMARFGLLILLSLGLAAGAGWLIAGRVLRPITQIRKTAHAIGSSDLSERIEISESSGGGELVELATEFNLMLDRIQESFDTQRQFVDDAGHELRTPLTIISGHFELMERDKSQAATSRLVIRDELARMTRMVQDLQTLTKSNQPGFIKIAPIQTTELFDELLVKASALGERNWILRVDFLEEFRGDRQRLTQAMLQLASNAVRHTQPKNSIVIGNRISGEYVELFVQDSGTGIPEAERERITERFVRGSNVSQDTEGSGLGLALVTAIAKAHNGSLIIKDSPLGGAELVIQIPRES